MDKLLTFINTLTESDRLDFAKNCQTSIGYLRKAISVNQKLGAQLCVAIEKVTKGEVTRKDLRPNDWFKIWPDLSKEKGVK